MNCMQHVYAYFSMINLVALLFVIVIAINIKNTFKRSIYSPVLSGKAKGMHCIQSIKNKVRLEN
jgi:hypothetical protein